jgi:hypothetical protein
MELQELSPPCVLNIVLSHNVKILVSFHFTLTFNFVYKNMNITKHLPFPEQHFYKFWFHYVGFFGGQSWQYWESTNTMLAVLF